MSAAARRGAAALGAGMLFGVGLIVAQMTNPRKVIGFLNVAGPWDPSLAFVMLGAISVYASAHHFWGRRRAPWLDTQHHLPSRKDLEPRLLIGSALFGIGWGLGGFCPGPALVTAATGAMPALIFVAAMSAGMQLERKWLARKSKSQT